MLCVPTAVSTESCALHFHLDTVYAVPQKASRIPRTRHRLSKTVIVSRAREDGEDARLSRVPDILPLPPCVWGILPNEAGSCPSLPVVNRHLDRDDFALPGPRHTFDRARPKLERRSTDGADDPRFHYHGLDRFHVERFHRHARIDTWVRQGITG